MKNYKKIITTFVLVCLTLAISITAVPAFAAGDDTTSGNIFKKMINSTKNFNLPGAGENANAADVKVNVIIGNLINAFLSIFGIIFMLLVIYGGYKWMMARGNEEDITKAKSMIRGAVIGLVIVMSAYAISYFVTSALQSATA